jgi:hypothetical protein
MQLRRLRSLVHLATLLLVIASLAAPVPARADGSFETLEVGLRYVADVSDTDFHAYWKQGRGVELFAVTPYGHADLHAGIRYLDNERRVDTVPEFTSLFVWAGASAGINIGTRTRLSAGISLGATNWFFDADDEPISGLQDELEMGTELFARARVELGARWNADASFRYQTSFTHDRIHLGFVTVGISRTFDSSWLKGVME